MKLSRIMTHGFEAVRPHATLAEAAEKMAREDIGALPVCGPEDVDAEQACRPRGIVSLGDLACSLREKKSGEVLKKVSEPD
jgi:CBS domain-containing protein